MNISLIKIGNSRGIRLPKKIIDQCCLEKELTLKVEGGQIILTPVRSYPREGWAEAARLMAERGDDLLDFPDVFGDEEPLAW